MKKLLACETIPPAGLILLPPFVAILCPYDDTCPLFVVHFFLCRIHGTIVEFPNLLSAMFVSERYVDTFYVLFWGDLFFIRLISFFFSFLPGEIVSGFQGLICGL